MSNPQFFEFLRPLYQVNSLKSRDLYIALLTQPNLRRNPHNLLRKSPQGVKCRDEMNAFWIQFNM